MKKILLLGELGKKFGRTLRLDVKSPAEAIRALCANFPEFERHMVESEKQNVGYRMVVGKEDISLDQLHDPAGNQEIKIVPVIQGAGGNGLTTILIGGAIVAAAFLTGGASLAATGMFGFGTALTTTTLGSIALGVGASLILSGVSQMLSPTPDAADPSERPENQPSYVFNGAVNTTAQGQPVPIGYGRLVVGSAVISAGITTEEIPV